MNSPSQSYAFSPTSFTHSCSISFDVGVKEVVGMSLRAMCFLPLYLGKLQPQLAALAVFLVGDCFKMSRVNASVVSTKMVKLQARWYIAYNKLIGKSMGTNTFPLTVFNIKRTISRFKISSHPNPTAIFSILFNLVPKSIFYVHNTIISRITTKVKNAGYEAVESLIQGVKDG